MIRVLVIARSKLEQSDIIGEPLYVKFELSVLVDLIYWVQLSFLSVLACHHRYICSFHVQLFQPLYVPRTSNVI